MGERPILFGAEMVRAILDGRKTQTRRVVKPRTSWDRVCLDQATSRDEYHARHGFGAAGDGSMLRGAVEALRDRCPYGQPGDTLWVREAWRTLPCSDGLTPKEIVARAGQFVPALYLADGHRREWPINWEGADAGRYRHARFMPRAFSRLTLRVTEVRIERVQAISEEGARAEGVLPYTTNTLRMMDPDAQGPLWRPAFEDLWDEINGKRPGCSWEANPWVWAVGFEVAGA